MVPRQSQERWWKGKSYEVSLLGPRRASKEKQSETGSLVPEDGEGTFDAKKSATLHISTWYKLLRAETISVRKDSSSHQRNTIFQRILVRKRITKSLLRRCGTDIGG
jgi:hypothetical protein